MAAIPFENLDVLLGRGIRLDLESVTAKLVTARRGGYCFEHGTLFQAALGALGVAATAHAARVLLVVPKAEAPRTHMFLTIEDGGLAGGLGSRLAQECRLADVHAEVREFGVPQRFIDHGTRDGILEQLGLTAQQLARFATETVLAQDGAAASDAVDQRG